MRPETPPLQPAVRARWEPPAAADLEQDPAARKADYVAIQRTYLNDAPLVFVANLGATAAWRSNVRYKSFLLRAERRLGCPVLGSTYSSVFVTNAKPTGKDTLYR